MAVRAACVRNDSVRALALLGLPVSAGKNYTFSELGTCAVPKLFLSGDHDQFAPREALEQVLSTAPEPKQMVWVEDADHFFQGIPASPGPKLDRMQQAMRTWLASEFALSPLG